MLEEEVRGVCVCVCVVRTICVIRQDAVKTLHVRTASLHFTSLHFFFLFFSFRFVSFSVPGESAKIPKKNRKNEKQRKGEKEKLHWPRWRIGRPFRGY